MQRRRALPNPPRALRMTQKLEDATRNFLNYLSDCMTLRSRDMVQFQDWASEISDELSALRAHYNLIHYRRKACKSKKTK